MGNACRRRAGKEDAATAKDAKLDLASKRLRHFEAQAAHQMKAQVPAPRPSQQGARVGVASSAPVAAEPAATERDRAQVPPTPVSTQPAAQAEHGVQVKSLPPPPPWQSAEAVAAFPAPVAGACTLPEHLGCEKRELAAPPSPGPSGGDAPHGQRAPFRELIKSSRPEAIELVARLCGKVLDQPGDKRFRSVRLTAIQKRLGPGAEGDCARVVDALCASGFAKMTEGSDVARLELLAGRDLALVRELVQMIERTRVLWKSPEADLQTRADNRFAEVMSTGCSRAHAAEAIAAAGDDTAFAVKLVTDGPKDAEGAPLYNPAFILNIEYRGEAHIHEVWNSPHELLPEYRAAAETICLAPKWVHRTTLGRCLHAINAEFKQNPSVLFRMANRDHFEVVLLRTIQKAYGLAGGEEARTQATCTGGVNIYETMCEFCFQGVPASMGGGGPQPVEYVTWALEQLLEVATPSDISAKLLEVCDHAQRCKSARNQAFNSLITQTFALTRESAGHGSQGVDYSCPMDAEMEHALARFFQCMEDYIDEHKAKAFTSAFLAPAHYYLHFIGDKIGVHNLPIHGLSWYLILVQAALGMALPIAPNYEDPRAWAGLESAGLVDFWKGLNRDAWLFFSAGSNFGKFASELPRLPKGTTYADLVECKLEFGTMPHGHVPGKKAMHIGNSAVNPCVSHAAIRSQLAVYLERFAHFFRADFFVRRALEVLNAEGKLEHVGFRRATETLYARFREEVLRGAGQETFAAYCYRDEYFTELDAERVEAFFAWLGVVRAAGGGNAVSAMVVV